MKWIKFQIPRELSINFLNSLPNEYWHNNKSRFFKKEHNCSLLIKSTEKQDEFILSSTHEDFTAFMISGLESFNIKYEYVEVLEETAEYEFVISKEIDQLYITNVNNQEGNFRAEKINQKYFSSHLENFESKLINVLQKIAKYEFEFSILIATSYLEELVNEAFKQSFNLDRYKKFEDNLRISLTFSLKIEFLYAKGLIDEKTSKTLYHLRKIRNLLAHQSLLEDSHNKSIDSHIRNIETICDNGILSRPETVQEVTDKRLLTIIPVIENLCIAFIGATYYINPFCRLGGVHYANKGYGKGFYYSITPEFLSERAYQHLETKYHQLNLKAKDYFRYGINVHF